MVGPKLQENMLYGACIFDIVGLNPEQCGWQWSFLQHNHTYVFLWQLPNYHKSCNWQFHVSIRRTLVIKSDHNCCMNRKVKFYLTNFVIFCIFNKDKKHIALPSVFRYRIFHFVLHLYTCSCVHICMHISKRTQIYLIELLEYTLRHFSWLSIEK